MIPFTEIFPSFSVDDLKKAKAFYRDVVGIPVSELPNGLSLQIAVDHFAFVYPSTNHKPAEFTVLNFRVDSVDEAVDELNKMGVEMLQYGGSIATDAKGVKRHGPGPVVAWFKDPAGNILSVMEQMPR